jgi:hypothetical protein
MNKFIDILFSDRFVPVSPYESCVYSFMKENIPEILREVWKLYGISKNKLNPVNCLYSFFFVYQPYGTQSFPDFIGETIDKKLHIITLECKSSKTNKSV